MSNQPPCRLSFLTLQETALLHLHAAGRGLLDAFRWDTVLHLVYAYASQPTTPVLTRAATPRSALTVCRNNAPD